MATTKRVVRKAAKKKSTRSITRTTKRLPGTAKAKRASKKTEDGLRFQPGTRFLCKVVRNTLGLSQREMAAYMGVSKKTIESYEQRWRTTPINVERLALLYLGCFKLAKKKEKIACWRMTKCPKKRREACVVWQVKRGDMCWLFGGTGAGSEKKMPWREKLERCLQCKVLRAVFE